MYRNLRLQVERYGLTSFQPGVPHTDRILWQATAQIYVPKMPDDPTSSLKYGTCFHEYISNSTGPYGRVDHVKSRDGFCRVPKKIDHAFHN